MSWERITDRITKCECGKGKTRCIFEMDDWNNSRSYEYVDCKDCYEKSLEYQKKRNECPNPAKHDDTKYILVEKIED